MTADIAGGALGTKTWRSCACCRRIRPYWAEPRARRRLADLARRIRLAGRSLGISILHAPGGWSEPFTPFAQPGGSQGLCPFQRALSGSQLTAQVTATDSPGSLWRPGLLGSESELDRAARRRRAGCARRDLFM